MKKKKKKDPLVSKPLDLTYKQIRQSCMKGLMDIGAVILVILLTITLYRLLPLCRDTSRLIRMRLKDHVVEQKRDKQPSSSSSSDDNKEEKEYKNADADNGDDENAKETVVVKIRPPSLRFGFATILQQQIRGFAQDLWLAIRLLLWTLLITVTLVRLFEFISEIADGGRRLGRTRMTLKLAVDIAVRQAAQIGPDFYQIFLLIFAWKTYKFAIATGLLELFATLCPGLPRRGRQLLAICIWEGELFFVDHWTQRFGGLIALLILLLGGRTPKDGTWSTYNRTETTQATLYGACFAVLGICFASFFALFGCVSRKPDSGDSPFKRLNRSDHAPLTIQLPRQCPQCQLRLQYGPLPRDNSRFARSCAFCEKYIATTNCYYCTNTNPIACEPYKKPYCEECANLLVVDSLKKQEEGAPGTVSDAPTILWTFPTDEYIAYDIRITWPNVLAVLGVIFEVGVMMALVFSIFYMQSNFSFSSSFHTPTDSSFHTLMDLSRV
ncbi:hypothetical protein RFI_27677 [Reticulomyxa filosa]|uniref:Uncharacterized protein n=1 Tax=Reticulomyxa filosa TaxID=46433 RepID=X6M8A6_RETFI|nr:hypothetical protein RFI_27677 [Reticulomyxa filosa]|eukprot:ETO09702.1 hypothetical protein RFI_27677 [Reticulomyxa filosa]